MSDVFISYARPDKAQVERLSQALEAEGLSVWWDRHIEAGHEFARDIEEHLDAAKAVIVCWSQHASASRWVKDEAGVAAEEHKLVSISLDGTPPPLGFKQYHALPLDEWKGGREEAEFTELTKAIRHRVDPEADVAAAVAKADSKSRTPVLIGATLVILAAIAFFIWQPWEKEASDDGELAMLPQEQTSIAVLAFEDLSQAGDQQYLADGISEEVLNVLARVDGLRVASRTSAFNFRDSGQPIPAIAEALDVRHVVEGSVRTSGDRVRITAQLIDGETDEHLWSQTYDRDLTAHDLFDIQDEIAKNIVAELGSNLDLGSTEALRFAAAAGTDNVAAYQAFLKARAGFNERGGGNDFSQVLSDYEKAVELDPEFAHAWVGYAAALSVSEGYLGPEGYARRDYPALARQAVERGIALAPDLSLGYTAKSNVIMMNGYSTAILEEADALLDHALTLDPRDSLAINWRGQTHATLGNFDAALADGERAVLLDPSDRVAWQLIAITHLYRDDLDAVLDTWNRTDDALGVVYPLTTMTFINAGREDDIRPLVEQAENMPPNLWTIMKKLAAREPLTPDEMKSFFTRDGREAPDVEKLDPFSLYMLGRFDLLGDIRHGTFPIYWLRTFPEWLDHPSRYAQIQDMGVAGYWKRNGYPPQCREIDPLPDGRDFECD